jgi:hypothetical protein
VAEADMPPFIVDNQAFVFDLSATPEQIATAAHATWHILQRKWRTVSGGLDLILDEAHPLGFWRKVMLELHGIDLPERQ